VGEVAADAGAETVVTEAEAEAEAEAETDASVEAGPGDGAKAGVGMGSRKYCEAMRVCCPWRRGLLLQGQGWW